MRGRLAPHGIVRFIDTMCIDRTTIEGNTPVNCAFTGGMGTQGGNNTSSNASYRTVFNSGTGETGDTPQASLAYLPMIRR